MTEIKILSNLSDQAREVMNMSTSIFKDVGDAIAEGIWQEFVILLNETPQWSGSTAASWNLSMGGDQSDRPQPEVKNVKQALEKGHQAAVQVAIGQNFKSLLDITNQYRYSAIVVENHSPGAVRAETGPVRPVNSPAGAFERFQERVRNHVWKPLRGTKPK